MSDNSVTDGDKDMKESAKSLPQSNHSKGRTLEPETDAKLVSEQLSSLDSKIEGYPTSETGISPEAESEQKPPLSNPSKPSLHSELDLYPIGGPVHTLKVSPSISIVNNNTEISNSEVLAHLDNNTIEIHDKQLIEPIAVNSGLPVFASHNSTNISPCPAEVCTSPDILTELERYLDGLDAIKIQFPAGDHT